MAEKSDDIKQLFSHLGLNPNDYHEIRSAPTMNATVSEAPRRWSLLQAVPAAAGSPTPGAEALRSLVPPAPVAVPKPSPVPAALLAAVAPPPPQPVAPRLEKPADAPPTLEPAPAAIALPTDLSAALFANPAPPSDGLHSLFQSVKEPQTAAAYPADYGNGAGQGERRTDQLFQKPSATPSLASRVADFDEVQPALLPTPQSLLPTADDEPETRYAAPPSRLGPIPATPPVTPAAFVPAPSAVAAPPATPAAGDGRLKLRLGQSGSAGGTDAPARESMQDVFRRLSGGH